MLDPEVSHWLMEEQPDATIAAVCNFLAETHGRIARVSG
jgi:hypothetical protein